MRILTREEKLAAGIRTEEKFFEAMETEVPSTPLWIYDIRRSSEQENHDGIDAVITLDTGEVPVQIKSSDEGYRKHLKHHGHDRHVVIILRTSENNKVTNKIKILEFLALWRRKQKDIERLPFL